MSVVRWREGGRSALGRNADELDSVATNQRTQHRITTRRTKGESAALVDISERRRKAKTEFDFLFRTATRDAGRSATMAQGATKAERNAYRQAKRDKKAAALLLTATTPVTATTATTTSALDAALRLKKAAKKDKAKARKLQSTVVGPSLVVVPSFSLTLPRRLSLQSFQLQQRQQKKLRKQRKQRKRKRPDSPRMLALYNVAHSSKLPLSSVYRTVSHTLTYP